MRCALLFLVPALALATPAYAEQPVQLGGDYYMVKPSDCVTYKDLIPGYVTCYDSDGDSTGTEIAMTDEELETYAIRRARTKSIIAQGLAQSNAQLQQYQAQNWNMIRQGQQSMPEIQPYSYQRTDGVWVYCNRTSSYTVACRTN